MCMKEINKTQFIHVCNSSLSMASAAAQLDMHYNTFKRHAVKLGCFKTNQSGRGTHKPCKRIIPLQEILTGLHPQYQTFKLKNRLLKEGILKDACSICGISEWQGKKLNIELDHVDGCRTNHVLKNLRMICPNCHSQTETFRAKNIS